MAKQTHEPGPGRSTAEAAFNQIRKEVSDLNERAHKEARKLRNAREKEQILRRRKQDMS